MPGNELPHAHGLGPGDGLRVEGRLHDGEVDEGLGDPLVLEDLFHFGNVGLAPGEGAGIPGLEAGLEEVHVGQHRVVGGDVEAWVGFGHGFLHGGVGVLEVPRREERRDVEELVRGRGLGLIRGRGRRVGVQLHLESLIAHPLQGPLDLGVGTHGVGSAEVGLEGRGHLLQNGGRSVLVQVLLLDPVAQAFHLAHQLVHLLLSRWLGGLGRSCRHGRARWPLLDACQGERQHEGEQEEDSRLPPSAF